MPQSITTANELRMIAAVPYQVMSPKECKPLIAVVQDVALGIYRLTKKHVQLSEKQFMNLMSTNSKFYGNMPQNGLFSGKDALSAIIPPGVNIKLANNSYDDTKDDKDNFVIIENGEIKQGTIDKKIYQNKTKGIIHSIYNDLGEEETQHFFDNTQKLICNWLVENGFSVGISDLIVDSETQENLKTIINQMKKQVYDIIRNFHTGKFENVSIDDNSTFFEKEVNKILNKAREQTGKLGLSKINDLENRMINMIKSGSKGSSINVAQMIACVGQQNVDGKRIAYGFDNRTLPHYAKYDDGPDSRGFVENSFISGLSPQEFFFHSMGGREGLIDTAVKSVTGDTRILVFENGLPVVTKIGQWIDSYLKEYSKKTVLYGPEDANMELLNISALGVDAYISSVDEGGNVSYCNITNITRHDPSEYIYKIRTKWGREVSVVASKSLLVWNDITERFEERNSEDVKLGDKLPTTISTAPVVKVINSVNQFELNRENGFFVGLYLADGDIKNDKVMISICDEGLKEKTEKWFQNSGIKYTREVMGICGHSALLVEFLKSFVGDKKVPNEAFSSPDDFVKGLVDGYISSNGCITNYHIVASSASLEMIEGMSYLMSRYGIFTKISMTQNNILRKYNLYIQSKYVHTFAQMFSFSHVKKQEKLQTLVKKTTLDLNRFLYEEQNNVVLDKVVSIQKIKSNDIKVYDITVPDTLNFQLFNGLQVRDTSETGYLQRKLVKAMEDNKINYDYTVRNANGSIIQFLYGEDGMDPIKIEAQSLPYIDMDYARLRVEYLLTKEDNVDVLLNPETASRFRSIDVAPFKEHFEQIILDRDFMIQEIFKGRHNNSFMYPVSFTRIINNAKALMKRYGMSAYSDLDPEYVLETIQKLNEELFVSRNNRGDKFISIMVRAHLSPKQIIFNHKLNRDMFDYIVEEVKKRFFEAIAHPSEMVGVIAAQSIGEPCTQLSCVRNSTIICAGKDGIQKTMIGDFIDEMLERNSKEVINLGNDSVVLNPTSDYYIIGVSDDEKTSWNRILQVSRHPANGGLVKIKTRSGKETCATLSHSFLKRTESGIVPIEGSKLKLGDRIPVAKYIPVIDNPIDKYDEHILNREFGRLCGGYIAGDLVDKFKDFFENNFGKDFNKCVPGWVYGSNIEFISGLLSGYFDANSDIQQDRIRAYFICIDEIILLLAYNGIFASKSKEYLDVSHKYATQFKEKIGFMVKSKADKLDKITEYLDNHDEIDLIPELSNVIAYISNSLSLHECSCGEVIDRFTLQKYISIFEEQVVGLTDIETMRIIQDEKLPILRQAARSDVIWDEIIDITYLDDPKEYVYDFTVPGNDSFMVDCGVLVHNTLNTFHHSGISSASKAVRGVPRIKELLSVTKNMKAPAMTVYINDPYCKDKMKCTEILKSIQTTYFCDIVKSSKIYYDPSDFTTDIGEDKKFTETYKELMQLELMDNFSTSPWLLRFEIDREKLLEEGLNMLTLYTILQDHYEEQISCMFSDDNSSNIVFRIRLKEDPEETDRDYITELKALEKTIMENIIIKGVKNVNKAMMNKQEYELYNPDTMQFEKTFEWVLDTSGTNLVDIMAIPEVDYTRTISNDINEVFELMGIEAARNLLYDELNGVISDAELYVNYRHLSLLVDTMTNRGYLLSIDRHGINRVDIGPLAKCSFEETTDMIIKAGIFSEVDKITGVSANIMLGQIPPCGTGDTEVLIDEHKLLNSKSFATEEKEEEEEGACTLDNLKFDFRMPQTTYAQEVEEFDIKIV